MATREVFDHAVGMHGGIVLGLRIAGLLEAARGVLESVADGSDGHWVSPDTYHHGSAYDVSGMAARQLCTAYRDMTAQLHDLQHPEIPEPEDS